MGPVLINIALQKNGSRSNAVEIRGSLWDIPKSDRIFRSTWRRGIILVFCRFEDSLTRRNEDLTKDTLEIQEDPDDPTKWKVRSTVWDRLESIEPFGRTDVLGTFLNPYTIYIPWSIIPGGSDALD